MGVLRYGIGGRIDVADTGLVLVFEFIVEG